MSPPVTLPSQPLGKNGPEVPRIGVGLMNISMFNKSQTEADKLAMLDGAWSKGEVFWDTGTSNLHPIPPSLDPVQCLTPATQRTNTPTPKT